MEDKFKQRLQDDTYKVVKETLVNNSNNGETILNRHNKIITSAYMDIVQTCKSLTQLLHYKKHVAKAYIECRDESNKREISCVMQYVDDTICKILGIQNI